MFDLSRLAEPFPAADIEWRVQDAKDDNGKQWARVLAYVTNRAIMDRLDNVVGPENWKNEYTPAPGGGILCGLSVWVDNRWITKWDGAENTQIEAVKGGLSGAMKRAAVQWGIGRYLYNLDAGWADICANGKMNGKFKSGAYFKWNPPVLPDWALPGNPPPKKTPAKTASKQPSQGSGNAKHAAVSACEQFAAPDVDAFIEAHAGGKAKAFADLKSDAEWDWLIGKTENGEVSTWINGQIPF